MGKKLCEVFMGLRKLIMIINESCFELFFPCLFIFLLKFLALILQPTVFIYTVIFSFLYIFLILLIITSALFIMFFNPIQLGNHLALNSLNDRIMPCQELFFCPNPKLFISALDHLFPKQCIFIKRRCCHLNRVRSFHFLLFRVPKLLSIFSVLFENLFISFTIFFSFVKEFSSFPHHLINLKLFTLDSFVQKLFPIFCMLFLFLPNFFPQLVPFIQVFGFDFVEFVLVVSLFLKEILDPI